MNTDISALAAEIFYTNVEVHGVDPTDRNAQDAALRQAYGQYDELIDFARAWDDAAAERASAVLARLDPRRKDRSMSEEGLQLAVWLDRDVSKFGSKADQITRTIDKSGLQCDVPRDEDYDRAYWYVYGPASAIFALNKALATVPDCDTDIN